MTPRERIAVMLEAVADAHGVSVEDMKGTCREPDRVAARTEAVLAMKAMNIKSCRIGVIMDIENGTVRNIMLRHRKAMANG